MQKAGLKPALFKNFNYSAFPAEKENAYEYTLKCVKDDKVYDLTSFGKEAGFYIENENSVLFCGNRKNIEKSTSLYRLALNGGEAKEIACFDKPGMNVLGYLNENTLVLMTKEKLVEEESDYEVFDEIPFYMNGQGITNKHRTHLYTYNLETKYNASLFTRVALPATKAQSVPTLFPTHSCQSAIKLKS